MSGITIVGSGRYLPGQPYTNRDLARVMDTSDDWIRQRTGIEQRHFCPEGQGASDLALPAARLALESAGRTAEDIDYIIFNTMTPDHILPGSGPLLGAKLGCLGTPALDVRTQCAAMIYSLQLADALLKTDGIRSILVVGAEAHAGFMPWRDWGALDGTSAPFAGRLRALHAASRLRGGFRRRRRRALASSAARPRSRAALGRRAQRRSLQRRAQHSHRLSAPSVHLARDVRGRRVHAAHERARGVSACREQAAADRCGPPASEPVSRSTRWTGSSRIRPTIASTRWCASARACPPEKVPSNIVNYGNTSAATIPILVDEMRRDERLRAGPARVFSRARRRAALGRRRHAAVRRPSPAGGVAAKV